MGIFQTLWNRLPQPRGSGLLFLSDVKQADIIILLAIRKSSSQTCVVQNQPSPISCALADLG